MSLHTLMQKFAKLEYAVVGKGPVHPDRNDEAVEKELRQFLANYPAFSEDPGIVEFFEYYGAISIFPPDPPFDDFEMVTYGFDEEETLSMSIAHPDESLEDDGYYRFAEIIVKQGENQYVGAEYAINVNDPSKKGIYHRVSPQEVDSRTISYTHYCDSFAEWLDRLVESKGKIL